MNIPLKKEEKIKVIQPRDIWALMQKILLRRSKTDRNREHLWVVCLNSANTIQYIELISMGSVSTVVVDPIEVFGGPLRKQAVKIILVHNHPSGEWHPSEADKDITNRLIQCGKLLNIAVTDHLIITETGFFSFDECGLMAKLSRSKKYVVPRLKGIKSTQHV